MFSVGGITAAAACRTTLAASRRTAPRLPSMFGQNSSARCLFPATSCPAAFSSSSPPPDLSKNQLWLLDQLREVEAERAASLQRRKTDRHVIFDGLQKAIAASNDNTDQCAKEMGVITRRIMLAVGSLGFIMFHIIRSDPATSAAVKRLTTKKYIKS